MAPYIEFIGTLQNCGFWLVQVGVPKPYIIGLLNSKALSCEVSSLLDVQGYC